MPERRKHDRSRTFEVATLATLLRDAVQQCVVRDLSVGGARLLLDHPQHAPVALALALRDGVRPARIVWRDDRALGVAFAGTPETGAVRGPAAAAVVSLDAVRRARAGDGARLAERIARFVRPTRRSD